MNIYITSRALLKVWAYVEAVKTEVGGFGYAQCEGEQVVVWDDTFLVPQEASTTEVGLDETSVAAAIERAHAEGRLDDPNFMWVSWHSHHSMNAYWSSTDEKCIKTYGALGIPYLLSFVGNHKREYKLRVDFFNVKHNGLVIPQVTTGDLKYLADPQDPIIASLQSEIDEMVREKPISSKKVASSTKLWDPEPKGKDPRPGIQQHDLDEQGMTLDEALEIRELMQFGMSREDAEDHVLYGKEHLFS